MGVSRIELGGVNAFYQNPIARIQLGGVNVIYTAIAGWALDFDTLSAISATLSVGDLPYAPWLLDFLVPYREQLKFNTKVLQSHNRTEQRIAKRGGVPYQRFTADTRIEKDDWPEFDSILNKWAKKKWAVPVWAELESYIGTLAADTTVITVDTQYADFRAGGYAAIWQEDQYEVALIESKTDSSLTLSSGLLNTYPTNCWIVPCVFGYLESIANIENFHSHVILKATWFIENPVTVTGFVAKQTYDSLTVLTEPSLLASKRMDQRHNPDIHISDYETGPFAVISNSLINEVSQPHRFRAETKEDCWWWRQFFHALLGRQKAFLVPTFESDLVLVDNVDVADDVIYVANSVLTDNMADNRYRNYIGFLQSGNLLIRQVTDISKASPDSAGVEDEVLTLDAAVGAEYNVGDGVCWVDKCRLSMDTVNLSWISQYFLECDVALIRIP